MEHMTNLEDKDNEEFQKEVENFELEHTKLINDMIKIGGRKNNKAKKTKKIRKILKKYSHNNKTK
jgi:hypothetical protein